MSNNGIDHARLSAAFKALGNPHRLAIVRRLIERELDCCDGGSTCTFDPDACNVGELAEAVDIAPSTTSHHLKELESAGVIERRREGRRLLCRVEPRLLERLREILRTPHSHDGGGEPA